jgi:GntR family transcriptional regulator
MLAEIKGVLYPNITKPLYMQLRDLLVDRIESGECSPGDALPGERDLAELYDISRVTVRKCISLMMDEGYVVRSHGKVTRVAQRKPNHNLGPLLGIVEELFSREGDSVSIEVLHKGYDRGSETVRERLRVEDSSKSPVYAFSRLIRKDSEPIALNYSFVPHEIGKIVDSLDLTKDKVFSYLEQCGYNLSYGEQEIIASLSSEEEASLLSGAPGQPVLVIRRTSFLENGYPILYEKTICRGDAYQYCIRLQRKL